MWIQTQTQPGLEPQSREHSKLWNFLLVLQQAKEAFLKEAKVKALLRPSLVFTTDSSL